MTMSDDFWLTLVIDNDVICPSCQSSPCIRLISTLSSKLPWRIQSLQVNQKKLREFSEISVKKLSFFNHAACSSLHESLLINTWDISGSSDVSNMKQKHSSKKDFRLVVCGNKCDHADQRQVELSEGKAFADKYGYQFFETSAKTRENLENAFMAIAFLCVSELPPSDERTGHCVICWSVDRKTGSPERQ